MNFFARVRHITRPLSNLETGVISQKKFSSRAFASQLPRNFLLHADRKRLPPTTSESWWRHALYYLRFNARNFNNIILSCVQLRVTRIPFRIIAPPPFLLSFRNFVIRGIQYRSKDRYLEKRFEEGFHLSNYTRLLYSFKYNWNCFLSKLYKL